MFFSEGFPMISKCANPDCDARFRYLRSGKLFHFEVAALEPVSGKHALSGLRSIAKKPPQRVEHFWLCDDCSVSMTLKQDKTHGVTVIPLKKHRATA